MQTALQLMTRLGDNKEPGSCRGSKADAPMSQRPIRLEVLHDGCSHLFV